MNTLLDSATETETKPAAPALTEIDGVLYDTETGELVGYVAPDGGQILDSAVAPVIDESFANWILRKMLARKARIQSAKIAKTEAEDRNRAIFDALLDKMSKTPEFLADTEIIACCDKIVEREGREYDFFERRFAPELARFAQSVLTGSKRTWASPFGSLSLRKTGEKLKVADEKKFIAWAKVNCPDAVKTVESALISKLPKTTVVIADIAADGDDLAIDGNGLEIVPESDELTITPGAK